MKNKRFVACALVLCACLKTAFCSGANESAPTENKVEQYQKVNYTDEKIKRAEHASIEKLLATKPVLALWQAKLLYEADTADKDCAALYTKAQNTVIDSFNKATENQKWIDAIRFYQSLVACGVKTVTDSAWNVPLLESKLLPENIRSGGTQNGGEANNAGGAFATGGAQGSETASATQNGTPRVSQMIRGTVTVWVDLGLEIKGGVGYANKMIGSGFFIDLRGYLITNHHVIENMVDPEYDGYARLYVSLADSPDDRIPAKVIGWDKSLDLALLKTEVTPPYVFTLGSSENLEIGDKIYAIGSPIGLDRTITSGIVSATDRKLLSTAVVMQIDAAINSGNSGGPTINEEGLVHGIVFAGILDYQGLNFAIPVEYLKTNLPRLYNGGKINHVWIGAYGTTARDELNVSHGVEIQYLKPGSAALKAGMVEGDVITAIDGVNVTTIEAFQDVLLTKIPDTIANITCRTNDGGSKTYSVYLSERPEYPGLSIYESDTVENYFLPLFGMKLTRSSGKRRYTVNRVLPSTVADETHFYPNDKIEVTKVRLSGEKDAISAEVYANKRRNGYVDIYISLSAGLDSPNFF